MIYVVVSKENKIRVLDYHGQLVRFVNYGHGIPLSFEKPVFISVSDTGKLYVSEWVDPGVIHCLALDGNTLYKYKDSELKSGECIYTDGGDNIIAFGHTNDNVYVIDKTGKKVKEIFFQSDGLDVPRCMAFRETDNSFIIGGYTERLLVFKMETV